MNHAPKRPIFTLMLVAASAWLVGLAGAAPAQAAAIDPDVRMFTLETPHFRVNYPKGYDAIAQKAAQFAEEAYVQDTAYFHSAPKNKTELTLMDESDEVNGLALPYVNNEIFIWITSPDSDELWGRYDNWLKLVITHEFAHICHFETVEGLPKHINDVFGRLLFPNLFQPTFLIEGLAVTAESIFSNHGKGGRGNDGYFDMYLRADVLNHRQLTIDQASGYYLTDFPTGDAPYVYGTFFYKYISATYGADKPPAIAHAYSAAPWLGIDHAVAEVLNGRDATQVWDEMLHWLRRRADVQLVAIKQHPVTLTRPVTTTGMFHRHPAYLPNGHLIFAEGLRHSPTALKEQVGTAANGQPIMKNLFNKGYLGSYDLAPDGHSVYYFDSRGPNNYKSFNDIVRHDLVTGEKTFLSTYGRLAEPGISPDGKRLLVVKNGRGENNILLLDAANGKPLRTITNTADNSQFTAPRWSPDGEHVVLSAWHDASRDLYLLDTRTWATVPLWKDEFVDVNPVWSRDGRYIVFASDRSSGVFNLFAYDWQKKSLFQMTNVLTGAIEPAISPDGKTVAMSVCTRNGFDIETMAWDPGAWREVPSPAFDATIKPFAYQQLQSYPSHAYDPFPSFFPKFWSPIYLPPIAGVFTLGYDVLLTNTAFVMAGYDVSPHGNVPPNTAMSALDRAASTVLYANTQFDTNVSLLGSLTPNKYTVPLAAGGTVDLYQRVQNYSFTLGWNNLPSPLTNTSYQTGDQLNIGYNVNWIQDLTPVEYNKQYADAKLIPPAGRSHSLSLTYKANTNGKYGYSTAPEYGDLRTYGVELAHPLLGSETEFYRLFGDYRTYFAMPWTHHTLAVRATGGLNFGKPQGDFYLGGSRSVNPAGVPDIRVASDPGDLAQPLRGYPFASSTGNTLALLSTEYRFPLLEFQHGIGTLPFFMERLSGVGFADTGTTFTNNWLGSLGRPVEAQSKLFPSLLDLRTSVGAELRLNFKIANNPLNTPPLATIARSALPVLGSFNDSAGVFRLGLAQAVMPIADNQGHGIFLGPTFYTEFGTIF